METSIEIFNFFQFHFFTRVKMSYDSATIHSVINKLNKSYFLPAIQRPFVWETEKIIRLFDSLMKRYPISAFLFWELKPETKSHWEIYKFVDNFKYGSIHNDTAETGGLDVSLVLDGQQRLTSLLIGLRGSYTVRQKHKRKTIQMLGKGNDYILIC
jgi:uncharacterized protein with ParB-like and HNH nuclease domain